MKPMPPELRAELQRIVPGFFESIERAATEGTDVPAIPTIDAFAGEPNLFFACAAYAHESGVALMLAPKTKAEHRSDATS